MRNLHPVNNYSGHKFLHDRSSLFLQSFYFHFYICIYFFFEIIYCIRNHRFTIVYKNTDLVRVHICLNLEPVFQLRCLKFHSVIREFFKKGSFCRYRFYSLLWKSHIHRHLLYPHPPEKSADDIHFHLPRMVQRFPLYILPVHSDERGNKCDLSCTSTTRGIHIIPCHFPSTGSGIRSHAVRILLPLLIQSALWCIKVCSIIKELVFFRQFHITGFFIKCSPACRLSVHRLPFHL